MNNFTYAHLQMHIVILALEATFEAFLSYFVFSGLVDGHFGWRKGSICKLKAILQTLKNSYGCKST